MNALVFCPQYDSPGKKDATGAFIPEALAFCDLHKCAAPVRFNNMLSMAQRRTVALARIVAAKPGTIDTLAVFSHGYKGGIQLGFTVADVDHLATALAVACAKSLTVALYCCDTARDADADAQDDIMPGPGGEGGFADALRNALRKVGVSVTIYGHASLGHCTRNPNVRVFRSGEVGGGAWLVEPGSPHWCEWRKALQDGTLRYRFPFMTVEAVETELDAGARGIA